MTLFDGFLTQAKHFEEECKNGRHEPEFIQYQERLETNKMAFKCSYFSMETAKVVKVDNIPLGILKFLLQICCVLFVVVYQLWYTGGYQSHAPVEPCLTTKIKGQSM